MLDMFTTTNLLEMGRGIRLEIDVNGLELMFRQSFPLKYLEKFNVNLMLTERLSARNQNDLTCSQE